MTKLNVFDSTECRNSRTTNILYVLCDRPSPEMSWQKDGGELPSTRTSFYNFKRTLKVSEVNEADGGDYRCTATNNLGTAYHIIKVTVKGKQLHLVVHSLQLVHQVKPFAT